MTLQDEYRNRSQADIIGKVCQLTDEILKLRGSNRYGDQARLQSIRRDRASLQELLQKPVLVWSAPK